VVEEVGSDEDSDTQGVGLGSSSGTRFVSDPLRFTGIDMSDGNGGRSRNSYVNQQDAEEDDDDTSGEDDDSDEDAEARLGAVVSEREEAVVESALERIRRAQAKGKKDVRLTQEELAALERRRERMHAQQEARKKRKEKEQRFAVPLSHLEPTVRKRRSVVVDEATSHQAVPGSFREDPGRAVFPPMGYFPPPLAAARSRPRSGTTSSQRPPSRDPGAERSQTNSPFRHSYGRDGYPPSSSRHVSDSAPRPPSSSSRQDSWPGAYSQGPPASLSAPSIAAQRQSSVDPFRYMTADSRAPAGRRNVSGPPGGSNHHVYGPGPAAHDSSRRRSAVDDSEETASENSDSTSEDYGVTRVPSSGSVGGAPIVGRRGRSREEVIVIEDSPEPEPQPEVRREREPSTPRSKKPSGGSSPVKRKPVGGSSSSSRRRKGR
jgi:PRA1 family protein 1